MPAISRFQRRNFLGWIHAGGYRSAEPVVIPYLLLLLEAVSDSPVVTRLLMQHRDDLHIELSPEEGLCLTHRISPRALLSHGVKRDALDSVLEALSWQVPHAVVAFWKEQIGDPLPTIEVFAPNGMLTMPITPYLADLIREMEMRYGPILFLTDWSLGEKTTGGRMLARRVREIGLPLAAEVFAGNWVPLPEIGMERIRLVRAYPLGFSEQDLLEELIWLELEQEGFDPVRALPADLGGSACLHRVADELHWWLQYVLVYDRIRSRGVSGSEYADLGIALDDEEDHDLDIGEILTAANMPELCAICGEHPVSQVCPATPEYSCHRWKGEFLNLVHRHGYDTPQAHARLVRDFMRRFIPFVRRRHHERLRRRRRQADRLRPLVRRVRRHQRSV